MFCIECRNQLPDNARFCPACRCPVGGRSHGCARCFNPVVPKYPWCAVCGYPAGPAPQQRIPAYPYRMPLQQLQSSGNSFMTATAPNYPTQGQLGAQLASALPPGTNQMGFMPETMVMPQNMFYHQPNFQRLGGDIQEINSAGNRGASYTNSRNSSIITEVADDPMEPNMSAEDVGHMAMTSTATYFVQEPASPNNNFEGSSKLLEYQDAEVNQRQTEDVSEFDNKSVVDGQQQDGQNENIPSAEPSSLVDKEASQASYPVKDMLDNDREKIEEIETTLAETDRDGDEAMRDERFQERVRSASAETPDSVAKPSHRKETSKRKSLTDEDYQNMESPDSKVIRVEKGTDVYGNIPDFANRTTCQNSVSVNPLESARTNDESDLPEYSQTDDQILASDMKSKLEIKQSDPSALDPDVAKEQHEGNPSSDPTNKDFNEGQRVFGGGRQQKSDESGTDLFRATLNDAVAGSNAAFKLERLSTEMNENGTKKESSVDGPNNEERPQKNTEGGIYPEEANDVIKADKQSENEGSLNTGSSSNSNIHGRNSSEAENTEQEKDSEISDDGEKDRKYDEPRSKRSRRKYKRQRWQKIDNNSEFSQMKIVQVNFHVVIPSDFNFNPNEDFVCVRLGHEFLGGWESNLWKLEVTRSIEEDMYLLNGKVDIPIDLLFRTTIAYKYCMQKKGKHISWESLVVYGHHTQKDRFLTIPNKERTRLQETLQWDQYDGIMIPQPPKDKAGLVTRAFRSVKKWVSDSKSLKDHVHESTRWLTLQILPKKEDILSEKNPLTAQTALKTIRQIFLCVQSQHGNDMVSEIAESYISTYLEDLDFKKRTSCDQLILGLVAAHLMVNNGQSLLIIDNMKFLCKKLLIPPNDEEATCVGWTHIRDIHFSDMKSDILDTLKRIVDHSVPESSGKYVNECWVYLLPLIHFLDESTSPYQSLPVSATHRAEDGSWWGVKSVKKPVEIWKRRTRHSVEFLLGEMIPRLKKCFNMDKYLERSLAACINSRHIPDLLRTHTFQSDVILGLAFYHVTLHSYPTYQDNNLSILQSAVQGLKRRENLVQNTEKEYQDEEPTELQSSHNALAIFKELVNSLIRLRSINFEILVNLCEMFRSCIDGIQRWTKTERTENGKCYRDVQETSDAICKHFKYMLSTDMVRYISSVPDALILCDSKELEKWSDMLSFQFVDEGSTSLWQTPFIQLLEARVDSLCNKDKLHLMCSGTLDSVENQLVKEIISKSAFEAIEKMCRSKSGEERFLFDVLSSRDAKNVGALMSYGFQKAWPEDAKEVEMLQHILTWPSFPGYMKTFSNSENHRLLSPETQEKIATARSYLEKVVMEVLDGTIEICLLDCILQNKQQLMILSKLDQTDVTSKQLETVIEWRKEELQHFISTKDLLYNFVQRCSAIEPVDCHRLKERLGKDVNSMKMSELVLPNVFPDEGSDHNPKLLLYSDIVPQSVVKILKPLMKIQGSSTFMKLWGKCGRLIRQREGEDVLSLEQVATKVWSLAHERVKEIYKRLASGDMSLKEVGHLFNDIGTDPILIKKEMRILSGGEHTDWIEERFTQWERYSLLRNYHRGAMAVLQAAKSLELTGNFDVLNSILETLQDDTKPLKSITEEMIKIGEHVKDINQEKTQCIEEINKCTQLVEWLKTNVKDIKQLKVLVDLAMISAAGQGDVEEHRVDCLHSAVTGYASLIYELKSTDGLKEFLANCQPVWKAIESDPGLPKKLHEMNRHLPWLMRIKESHGAVEVSALAQAKAINARGVYRLGVRGQGESYETVDCVVKLVLPPEKGDKDKEKERSFTVQQLNDLQSKLMLVAGKAEKGKDGVEQFVEILDAITRLARAYIKLCQAGSVLFQDCNIKFFCNPKKKPHTVVNFPASKEMLFNTSDQNMNVYKQICDLSKFMEDCLEDWLLYVNKGRDTHDQLNNYTTEQLVILRREIVKLCGEEEEGPTAKLYPLLHYVRPDCTTKELNDALQKADRELATRATEVEMEENEENDTDIYDGQELKLIKIIEELIEAGHHERLAQAAVAAVGPDISNAFCWCVEHEDEIMGSGDALGSYSEDTEMMEDEEETIGRIGFVTEATMTVTTGNFLRKLESKNCTLNSQLQILWKQFLEFADQSVADFLSVEHLGIILKHLKIEGGEERVIPANIIVGKPNLIVCPQANLLDMVLSMYMQSPRQALPSAKEVLLCDENTTAEQIELLWRRAVSDSDGGLYCLANAGALDYEVSEKAENSLDRLTHGNKDFKLVVICTSETEDQSRLVTALDTFRVANTVPMPSQEIKKYLHEHFTISQGRGRNVPAATLDPERCGVRVIQSHRAGVGKTLRKSRFTKAIRQIIHAEAGDGSITIPLQDKKVEESQVLTELLQYVSPPGEKKPCLFHIDIAHEVQEGVDHLLFNLLVLGSLTDKTGYVWQKSDQDLYIIETLPLMYKSRQDKGKEEIQSVHHILPLLPTITCRSPVESRDYLEQERHNPGYIPLGWDSLDQKMDGDEFRSQTFQRVYQYLSRLSTDREFGDVDPRKPEGTPLDCLNTLLRYCGIRDPSWAELRHFVSFLNIQLHDCELSAYCGMAAADILPGFLTFVVKFMIQMSTDFATRSLQISEQTPGVESRMEIDDEDDEENQLEQLKMRRTWESSPHPYIFFNPDHNTLTFLGFYIDRKTRDLLDQETNRVLEREIMSQPLQHGLYSNRVPLEEKFDALKREEKISRLCQVFGNNSPYEPDVTYELTTDNVKKILAIHMRFRCGIPVIVMGETGCGKTRLIKFMCDLQIPAGVDIQNMVLMKVHGGTTKVDIARKVNKAIKLAQQNQLKVPGIHTVIFFDEANTTEAIEMIKEILCDHSMSGRPLHGTGGLKFIAACNPYRKHSDEMIRRLEQAGLGYHTQADKTTDRLGRIPMRQLVYRVHALPQSLLPLVWDFGQLNAEVERLYIRQIVNRYIISGELKVNDGREAAWCDVITRVLGASQQFMRNQRDECSFVSLRDVERVMNVMVWFSQQDQLFDLMDEKAQKELNEEDKGLKEMMDPEVEDNDTVVYEGLDNLTRSLILALGVCYHARLNNRQEYRRKVAPHFVDPADLDGGDDEIEVEIIRCQDVFLDEVKLEDNIAKNKALKENVFMMIVCIELRIPLFLVGKPGSSKSLAKTIVADAMQGKQAHSDLFKSLKQVHMMSFQCSPLSTADGIVGTFQQCARLQKDKNLDEFVSVVVLDEVGLAEDSPRMPLKALHPLLEDGCEGDEEPEPYKKVAFIGISNWALDPAKMNRGIMVQRGIPDENELINSAKGICATNQKVLQTIKPYVKPMAEAYLALYNSALEIREFFGLRDFYSLVKMVYGFSHKSGEKPTWLEMKHAILRNFGGLDGVHPVKEFEQKLAGSLDVHEKARKRDPDCSAAGLIKACLKGDDLSSESRYLLILTENYAALPILQQHLQSVNDAIIIFGSSFPKDQEYTQVCRNINRVKVCMETGKTVVLLNLDNLYESLYDALNQYYSYFADQRFVDLGLGTHRVKCRVHQDFRLIVVAEKKDVYLKFPIPLINRLEKHCLATNNMLTQIQLNIAEELNIWALDFAKLQRNSASQRSRSEPTVGDVFIGYHPDAAASVTFDVCRTRLVHEQNESEINPAVVLEIVEECKRTILQCATPEALVRLPHTKLMHEEKRLMHEYFNVQKHGSLEEYLTFKLVENHPVETMFMQITTHSRLLAGSDINSLTESLNYPAGFVVLHTLQAFDIEQQFCKCIKEYFNKEVEGHRERLLILQCDSSHSSSDLVACARHILWDEYNQAENKEAKEKAHVLLLLQLPRIAGGCFVGFQGGVWESVHIDELRPHNMNLPSLNTLRNKTVGQLFEASVQATVGDQAIEDEVMLVQEADGVSTETRARQQNRAVEVPCEMALEVPCGMAVQVPCGMAVQVPCGMAVDDEEEAMDTNEEQVPLADEPLDVDTAELLDVEELLRNSIQGAAAMLKDRVAKERTTSRVQMLLLLLDRKCGYKCIMEPVKKRVAGLLKDKEETTMGALAQNWSQDAASVESVNKAGTLSRSLWTYLLSKATPLLAGLVANTDVNYNLDIIYENNPEWIHNLWLDMLSDSDITPLRYTDLPGVGQRTELSEVPVQNTGYDNSHMKANLPFSWLIKEKLDEIVLQATKGNEGPTEVEKRCTKIFEDSAMGHLLSVSRRMQGSTQLVDLYIKDFVQMVYKPQSKDAEGEYELIERAIRDAWTELCLGDRDPDEETGVEPKEPELVAIHVTFHEIQHRMKDVAVICRTWPQCVAKSQQFLDQNLENPLNTRNEMTIDIIAVKLAVDDLDPVKDELVKPEGRKKWIRKVEAYQAIVDRVLSFGDKKHLCVQIPYGERCRRELKELRPLWNRVTVMKLFIQHMCPPDEADETPSNSKHITTLWKLLDGKSDFKKKNSMEALEKFLKSCYRAAKGTFFGNTKCPVCKENAQEPVTLKCKHVACLNCLRTAWEGEDERKCPECKENVAKRFELKSTASKKKINAHNLYKKRCNAFFMEVVSQLCFKGGSPPEEDLVDLLMQYVLKQRGKKEVDRDEEGQIVQTKRLSLFDDHIDDNPVVRSLLIQLLLSSNMDEDVKAHIQQYFDNVKESFVDTDENVIELAMLFTQCLEDSYQSMSNQGNIRAVHIMCARHLREARQDLFEQGLDVDKLEAIAKTRFGLGIVANWMYGVHVANPSWTIVDTEAMKNLFRAAQVVCDQNAAPWPRTYLIKQIVRIYGLDALKIIFEVKSLSWVLPEHLRQSDEPDKLLALGKSYKKVRDTISEVYLESKTDGLEKVVNKACANKNTSKSGQRDFLMALFKEVTAKFGRDEQVQPEILQLMGTFIEKNKNVEQEQRALAEALLSNRMGRACRQLTIDPTSGVNVALVEVLTHYNIVLRCTENKPIIQPFLQMVLQTNQMQNAYLPTMPQDELTEVREALLLARGGNRNDANPFMWECPNGHPYVIGDCGRPVVQHRCLTCGAAIGGVGYNPAPGNKHARQVDITQHGHVLGDATKLIDNALPERELSSSETAIVRFLLHGSMFLAANENPQLVQALIKAPVGLPVDQVPNFLWNHIRRDLRMIQHTMGCSPDDVLIILHIIISGFLNPKNTRVDGTLPDKKRRMEWESAFAKHFLKPIIQTIPKQLQEANNAIASDDKLGDSRLMRLVFETSTVGAREFSVDHVEDVPQLWRYRRAIDMISVKEHLNRSGDNKLDLLRLFLKEVNRLELLGRLPNIMRLVRHLVSKFHHRLDRAQAQRNTIGNYIKSLPKGLEQEELTTCLYDYFSAWHHIKVFLPQFGFLGTSLPQELCNIDMGEGTCIATFLPSLKGHGTCTVALVEYLVTIQNTFLGEVGRITKKTHDLVAGVDEVSASQLVSFNVAEDIITLAIAHCNYSLEIGKGTIVEYDFDGLQRQLFEKFIRGRPRLITKLESSVYQQEITNAAVLNKLHMKINQESLSGAVHRQIVAECRDFVQISESLANLEIAIGFLQSVGGQPDTLLSQFMTKTLSMKEPVLCSPKAYQVCQLKHAQSLWLLLSHEKSKIHNNHRQDPFENVGDQYYHKFAKDDAEKLRSFLNHTNVELFLAELYECIVLQLTTRADVHAEDYVDYGEMRLCATLYAYLDATERHAILPGLTDGSFPPDLLGKHAVECWKSAHRFLQIQMRRN